MPRVTYVPLENGDPLMTSFGGFDFRNGEPVEIPADAKVLQTMVREVGRNQYGEPLFRGVDTNVPVIDVLKTNPYFRIEGMAAPPPKAAGGRPRMPRTPEEYKSFAMAWFGRAESHTALAQRWDAEQELREKLGVHEDSDIVSYLRPFFDAKFHELKRAA